MQENRSKQVMQKFWGQEETFLTVPSAASLASSSVAIAPDQNEKEEEEEDRRKEKGKKKDGVASLWKRLVSSRKAGGLYTDLSLPLCQYVFYCWAVVRKQWQTDSALDRELALA